MFYRPLELEKDALLAGCQCDAVEGARERHQIALLCQPPESRQPHLWCRTIDAAGEEQGLLGSKEYIALHYGAPPPNQGRGGGGGAQTAPATPPPPPTPEQQAARNKFAGYFNIDNGTGAIRGVYMQSNPAVATIFRDWMEPFHTIGMTTLTIADTGGTDHQSFDRVGLPGFQFIQDDV